MKNEVSCKVSEGNRLNGKEELFCYVFIEGVTKWDSTSGLEINVAFIFGKSGPVRVNPDTGLKKKKKSTKRKYNDWRLFEQGFSFPSLRASISFISDEQRYLNFPCQSGYTKGTIPPSSSLKGRILQSISYFNIEISFLTRKSQPSSSSSD